MNYGIPYMGSKNKVLPWLAAQLPPGRVFVDLFCGGCSVTHYMMRHHRYPAYIVNDLNPMLPRTFQKALRGGYRDERRWISREDFFRLKATDEYAAICFSFGNDLHTYMYGEPLEPYKRACHMAVVFDEWAELERLCPETWRAAREGVAGLQGPARRKAFGTAIIRWLKANGTEAMIAANPLYRSARKLRPNLKGPYSLERLESLESLERLESLESLERLERLQSLERLERLQSLESLESLERLESLESPFLTAVSGDYQDVELPEGAVVYCDPPYRGTATYAHTEATACFDHERFYAWALAQPQPIYISEYAMPQGFTCIAANIRNSSMNDKKVVRRIERLFVQSRFADRCRRDFFAFE